MVFLDFLTLKLGKRGQLQSGRLTDIIQTGSNTWPQILQSPKSASFLRGRPWNFAHAFNVPRLSLCTNGLFLSFFARYFSFVFLFLILGSQGIPHFQPWKETHTLAKGSACAHKYVCKISGSFSQKRRGNLDFCAVKGKSHGLAS